MLINGREKVGIKKNLKALIDYLQIIDDVYKKQQHHKSTKEMKVLIVFDDKIVDIESNKKLSPITTELFFRGKKLNISLFFYFTILFQST